MATSSKECAFFDTLPAELRNQIYELSFTTNACVEEIVEVNEAAPPSKDLLLASRQAHHEGHQIYLEAYREYWRTTKFKITIPIERAKPYILFEQELPDDINNIRHLVVIGKLLTSTLLDPRGLWHFEEPEMPADLSNLYIPVHEPGDRDIHYRMYEDPAAGLEEVVQKGINIPLYAQISTLCQYAKRMAEWHLSPHDLQPLLGKMPLLGRMRPLRGTRALDLAVD